MQQRKEKQQEDKKRLRRQAEDLQASMEAKDDVTGLAAQTRHMEDMRARVVQELDKGDADTGGVEPDVWQQALYPVQVGVGSRWQLVGAVSLHMFLVLSG
jgi:hypothetical protein